MKEKINNEEIIKKIITPEIYYYTKGIETILQNKKNNLKEDVEFLIDNYKFFEGIKDIKENNIIFNDAINLFKEKNEEEKIELAKNIFDSTKNIFDKYEIKFWDEKEKLDNLIKKIEIIKKKYKEINEEKKKKDIERINDKKIKI